jgi:rifampicin phosphotransferase
MALSLQLRYQPGTGVVRLEHERATDATVTGAKASRLALAAGAGLPVLPGFVLCTDGAAAFTGDGAATDAVTAELRAAWEHLTGGGRLPVVVRSSSPNEDTESSSMAGQFHSEVGVEGWTAFLDAVRAVIASASVTSGRGAPMMGVLVQRHLDPPVAGVLFGVDPVSGDPDHRVAVAVSGGPQALVSGETEGATHTMSRTGRLLSTRDGSGGHRLRWRERRVLVALERDARALFGGPQDIEWAIDGRDVWLLQSRPVTATGEQATGPVYGTGPIAETFPLPLSILERDLWLPPLEAGMREALSIVGAARRKRLRGPLVVAPHGWPAVDLEAIGALPRRGVVAKLDPRPGFRKLRTSWRVGRTRAALGAIVADLVERTDHELSQVPPVRELEDLQLLQLLHQGGAALRSLHGHEMLAGILHGEGQTPTALALALRALGDGRALDEDDGELLLHRPEVLALLPPAIGPPPQLPVTGLMTESVTVDDLPPREALRLRVRWLHELTGRAAWELAARLVARGQLRHPDEVRAVTLDALSRAIRTRESLDIADVPAAGPTPPTRFRLAPSGAVIAAGDAASSAQGAGGGRGRGPVHLGDEPPAGSVLVTPTLDPALATHLSRLAGLVAETGSPLSHLAILAREQGIPTVVGFTDATERFSAGEIVVVDGTTGEVRTEAAT